MMHTADPHDHPLYADLPIIVTGDPAIAKYRVRTESMQVTVATVYTTSL
jgi:hypothetical protein